MQPKPNPADFTHNGELQQPHYDNAVRAWEKLEAIENDELEKAALVKVAQYFKYPFSSSCKEAVELFKAGAEWANEQKGWVRLEDRLPAEGQKVDLWLVLDGKGNGQRHSWHWEKQDTAQIRITGCQATHWMPYPEPPTI